MNISYTSTIAISLSVLALISSFYSNHSSKENKSNTFFDTTTQIEITKNKTEINQLKQEIIFLQAKIPTFDDEIQGEVKLDLQDEKNKPLKNNLISFKKEMKNKIAIIHQLLNKQDMLINSQYAQYQNNNNFINDDSMKITVDKINTQLEETKNKNIAYMEIIDNNFQSEPIDQQWSTGTVETITALFETDQKTQTELANVQCHSNSCLLNVRHQDAEAAEEFSLHLSLDLQEDFPQIQYQYQNNEDGSIDALMYLARKGYEFPAPSTN